jgi:hypothetical protein
MRPRNWRDREGAVMGLLMAVCHSLYLPVAAVADTLDAMCGETPYRVEDQIRRIEKESGLGEEP